MTNDSRMTVAQAQARFFAVHGMPPGGGYAARWWRFRIGSMVVALPNFQWRRRAIAIHDLQHIVTGFPCTPIGEMQMAAWEFAAGPFPDWRASLFCAPLVGLGAVVAPKRTFAAFVLGRQSRTLYATNSISSLLDHTIGALRAEALPQIFHPARKQDRRAYRSLLLRSWSSMAVHVGASLTVGLSAVALFG